MLKPEMAGAIRATGWFAELEVAAADGSWRADVRATSPDGEQRMAWEAQLSPITVEDVTATDRYAAEGVSVWRVSPQCLILHPESPGQDSESRMSALSIRSWNSHFDRSTNGFAVDENGRHPSALGNSETTARRPRP